MANFTAQDVKKLRDMTGAGMMDCKNALTETDGEMDQAAEVLRIKSGAKLDKKAAERTAANGIVAAAGKALIELKCETDFVAKNEAFVALANAIAETADAAEAGDAETLAAATMSDGKTVTEAIREAAAGIGEKLELGRVARFDGETTVYLHKKSTDLPPQAGVLVEYTGADADVARGAAMQAAAMRPQYLTRDEVPADVVETERRVAEAKSREEGKPEAAMPKIVEGRVNGFYKEVVLLEQASVQDNKKTVKQLLDAAGVTVTRFAHIEVGG